MIRFAEPWFLGLLALLPLVWWLGMRLRTVERGRRYAILGVRTVVILCLVLALARTELVRRSSNLVVYFLLDVSESVPPQQQDQAKALVREFSDRMTPRDEAGIIVFGAQPSLEETATNPFEFRGTLFSQVETTRTDLSAAMRLAMAAFPADRMRRIVLFSDGNENAGSALEVARLARNNGIPIDVVPLRYSERSDVAVEKIVVPQQTTRDAPFNIDVFVRAERDTVGTVVLYEDGKVLARQENVELKGGRKTQLSLPRRLAEGGFHRYTAVVESAGDTRPQNNRGEAFTWLKGEPLVLLVNGNESEEKNYLEGALRAENIRVETVGPERIPNSLEELQRYDSVILSNVGAGSMTYSQMEMIERAVHDLGVGLVMVGGENAFGAGGWQDTPVEKALPVSMEIKQKKVLPAGALAIILHTCEIPSGNAWARDIALAALDVLSERDYFGIAYYGPSPGSSNFDAGFGDNWLWTPAMQQVGSKSPLRAKIKTVAPADMPVFEPTMKMAHEALKPLNTQVKHMIMISDGDPQPVSQEFVQAMRDDGITISTVAIAPHVPEQVETLENIAFWGRGTFYYPKTSAELPRIFIKEASIVRKTLISEEPFTPVYTDPSSEILVGLQSGLPQLRGHVVTSMKDLARQALASHEDDPLLAHWRYGLGKSVAFTSDATNRWSADWVVQDLYAKFWSQLVRWSLRETGGRNYQVSTEVAGNTGRVVVDALDDDGNFRNNLEFEATVIGPNLESTPVIVRQTGPGRYEGTFPADATGSYMVSLRREQDGERELVTTGASVAYSPEFGTTRSNDDLLEKIASATGGKVADARYNPFRHDMEQRTRPTPLWPLLLWLGLFLVPVDIFLRRVYLEWSEVRAWFAEKFAFRRARQSAEQDTQRLAALKAAKARATSGNAREQAPAEAAAPPLPPQPAGSYRDRILQRGDQSTGTEPSVFREPDTTRGTSPKPRPGDPGQPPTGASFTSSLLEARRRAQRRTGSDEPPAGEDKK